MLLGMLNQKILFLSLLLYVSSSWSAVRCENVFFKDSAFVLRTINLWHKERFDLRPDQIKSKPQIYQKAIDKSFPFPVSVKDFFDYMRETSPNRDFSDWVRLSGINPDLAKRPRNQSDNPGFISKIYNGRLFLDAINLLHRNGLDINVNSIKRGGPEYARLLSELVGQPTSSRTLYEHALKSNPLKKWSDWVRSAGLNPALASKKGYDWTREVVLEVLKEMQVQGLPLNHRALFDGRPEYNQIIKRITGVENSGLNFINGARKFQRWDSWLVEIGLNPNEVRLRGNAPYHLLTASMQAELGRFSEVMPRSSGFGSRDSQGNVQREVIDDVTPETIVAKKNINSKFSLFYGELSEALIPVADAMLEYFSQGNKLDIKAMAKFATEEVGRKVTEKDVGEFLNLIRENEVLREALLDSF